MMMREASAVWRESFRSTAPRCGWSSSASSCLGAGRRSSARAFQYRPGVEGHWDCQQGSEAVRRVGIPLDLPVPGVVDLQPHDTPCQSYSYSYSSHQQQHPPPLWGWLLVALVVRVASWKTPPRSWAVSTDSQKRRSPIEVPVGNTTAVSHHPSVDAALVCGSCEEEEEDALPQTAQQEEAAGETVDVALVRAFEAIEKLLRAGVASRAAARPAAPPRQLSHSFAAASRSDHPSLMAAAVQRLVKPRAVDGRNGQSIADWRAAAA